VRVLVVGSGGREHALAWKLAQDSEVLAAPGNPGIAEEVECVDVGVQDRDAIVQLCGARDIDLVVVGPEDPLIAGLADELRQHGLSVYGPGREGALLEGSKAFSKGVMREAGIPTARFGMFSEVESAKRFARQLADSGSMPVVKASGNALGKGVVVARSLAEAESAIDSMIVGRQFGTAGETVVIEERLTGYEFSLLTICAGKDFVSLPVAQDFKRVRDGDHGPNTGGMGSYSPVPAVPPDLVRSAEETAVAPLLDYLKSKNIDYRGTLFSGFMVQSGQPYCLEYNVRFGDPETQSVVRRLGSGFAAALKAAADGNPIPPIEVLDNHAVTVVLASSGYPGAYPKGIPVSLPEFLEPSVKVFHAGTTISDGRLVTNGGRVLGVAAVGESLEIARETAYDACERIEFEGKYYRRDIAAAAL
jgi:phosphoribosylamine---glycine ligase